MLESIPFAHAVAIISLIFYLVFWLMARWSPSTFKYLFDAQFFGASASSLFKEGFKFSWGVLISLVITTWIVGYLLAWLYNYFL